MPWDLDRDAGVATAGLVDDQSGMTLIELLVAAALLTIVLGATLAPMNTSATIEKRDVALAEAIRDGQIGLQRMVREVRQAYSIREHRRTRSTSRSTWATRTFASSTSATCPTPRRRATRTASSYRRCVRIQAIGNGALPSLASGEVVIDRLLNGTNADPVFTYTPNTISPKFIAAKIESDAGDATSPVFRHAMTFEQGLYLRNLNLGA